MMTDAQEDIEYFRKKLYRALDIPQEHFEYEGTCVAYNEYLKNELTIKAMFKKLDNQRELSHRLIKMFGVCLLFNVGLGTIIGLVGLITHALGYNFTYTGG